MGDLGSRKEAALVDLAARLAALGFEQTEPDPLRVAVAEAAGARLITDDT